MPADVSTPVTLAVDLDGTLVRSDLFVESLLTLIRQNPLAVFSILIWACSGRAAFKRRVSERVQLDPKVLPYLEEVLQFVRTERAAGRRTVLATGSDQLLVQPVADYLGCFDAVVASDGSQNRTGRSKERLLTESCGESGFDYIGNSVVDLPVWRSARYALLAARSERLGRVFSARLPLERVFYYPRPDWSGWAQLLHLRYWCWNLLVFVPLLTFTSLEHNVMAALFVAFVSLNLCSSGILLAVDLLNLSRDRQHPRRCARPLAAGDVYLPTALFLAPMLLLASLLLTLPLGPLPGLLLLYGLVLLVTALWGSGLILTAAGNTVLCALRVLAAGAVIGISLDQWLAALPL
jgi:hypothetical protein